MTATSRWFYFCNVPRQPLERLSLGLGLGLGLQAHFRSDLHHPPDSARCNTQTPCAGPNIQGD
jgi:hypothetical protein